MRKFDDAMVEAVFESWPATIRPTGLRLRQLIFETAAKIPEVIGLHETLKWNQPAYLTLPSGTGTTVRVDALKDGSGLGLYFHCQTNLVETFKSYYDDQLTFEKKRVILLDASDELPIEALQHCIGLALTYHVNKSRC